MKIFQKTRKVAKKKKHTTQKAAAGGRRRRRAERRKEEEEEAPGRRRPRARPAHGAAAALRRGGGGGRRPRIARRPDVRGVQAAQGKRRPRAERWRGGGEAPDAWVQARVAAVVPGAAAALERALAATPATAPPFLPLGDVSTATWATATPTALVAWDGDQLRLDGVEATLEAAEAP